MEELADTSLYLKKNTKPKTVKLNYVFKITEPGTVEVGETLPKNQ